MKLQAPEREREMGKGGRQTMGARERERWGRGAGRQWEQVRAGEREKCRHQPFPMCPMLKTAVQQSRKSCCSTALWCTAFTQTLGPHAVPASLGAVARAKF